MTAFQTATLCCWVGCRCASFAAFVPTCCWASGDGATFFFGSLPFFNSWPSCTIGLLRGGRGAGNGGVGCGYPLCDKGVAVGRARTTVDGAYAERLRRRVRRRSRSSAYGRNGSSKPLVTWARNRVTRPNAVAARLRLRRPHIGRKTRALLLPLHKCGVRRTLLLLRVAVAVYLERPVARMGRVKTVRAPQKRQHINTNVAQLKTCVARNR